MSQNVLNRIIADVLTEQISKTEQDIREAEVNLTKINHWLSVLSNDTLARSLYSKYDHDTNLAAVYLRLKSLGVAKLIGPDVVEETMKQRVRLDLISYDDWLKINLDENQDVKFSWEDEIRTLKLQLELLEYALKEVSGV